MESEYLDKYLMPITLAGYPLDNGVQAYKMDCTKDHSDMRKDVGLGTCNCCDFFQIHEGNILLIEETQLFDSFKDLKIQGLQNKEIIRRILLENRLKVYGSMLVLCRLVMKFNSKCSFSENKHFVFVILVSSQIKNEEDSRFFDDLSTRIRDDLRSSLTKEIVSDVEIGNPDWFKEKYFYDASLDEDS